MLKKHGSLEQIQFHNPGVSMDGFPFERVREIFLDDQGLTEEHIAAVRYCGIPDSQRLLEFCFHNNCRFDLPRLFQAFTTNPHIEFSAGD